MWQVWINNFLDRDDTVIPGWSQVTDHTNEVDANRQMQIYITNNGVSPDDVKVVFNEEV